MVFISCGHGCMVIQRLARRRRCIHSLVSFVWEISHNMSQKQQFRNHTSNVSPLHEHLWMLIQNKHLFLMTTKMDIKMEIIIVTFITNNKYKNPPINTMTLKPTEDPP